MSLSSDVFTGFGKDKSEIHNAEARAAELYLLDVVLPRYKYFYLSVPGLNFS